MIKRIAVLLVLAFFLFLFLSEMAGIDTPEALSGVGAGYVERSIGDLNSPNVVTAIVVTYRGIDTLGDLRNRLAFAEDVSRIPFAGGHDLATLDE